jgi:hypothetical protein
LRSRWIVPVVVALLTFLPASSARAKSVSDPKDINFSIDFKSVSLTRPTSSKMVWTVRSWYTFRGSDMTLGGPTLQLDTRSGKAIEYKVEMSWSPATKAYYCQLRKAGGGTLADGKVKRPDAKTAKCVFSSSQINRSKPIHWRAKIDADSFGTDVAPNSGWVVGI